MEQVKHERQRFQFSTLALFNALVAILAIVIGSYSAAREPAYLPAKPGLEAQLKAGLAERDLREIALDLAEKADRGVARLHTALLFQQIYAWVIAVLLLFNTFALIVFFRRLRKSQKREAAAYESSTATPAAPSSGLDPVSGSPPLPEGKSKSPQDQDEA